MYYLSNAIHHICLRWYKLHGPKRPALWLGASNSLPIVYGNSGRDVQAHSSTDRFCGIITVKILMSYSHSFRGQEGLLGPLLYQLFTPESSHSRIQGCRGSTSTTLQILNCSRYSTKMWLLANLSGRWGLGQDILHNTHVQLQGRTHGLWVNKLYLHVSIGVVHYPNLQ